MASLSTILKYLEINKEDRVDQNSAQRAKKRRLDHLSWEEKIQRKKLKNRVAAQTSRDRKKAKMEQLEQAVQQLFTENESLLSEAQNLKQINERLLQENTQLNDQLNTPCPNCAQNRITVGGETPDGSTESILRQRGGATRPAAALSKRQTEAVWKIVLSCLLYQTCSTNSMQMSTLTRWNNSRRAFCKISPETWRLLLKKQIFKNQAVLSICNLESWRGSRQHNWNPPQQATVKIR